MKAFLAACVLAVVATAAALARPNDEKQYTDKFDSVNLPEILENDRVLENYFECIVGNGKCTPDAKELKEHIAEALENNCAKCTEKQKEGTRTVIGHLINNKPEHWKKLCDKYDPERKYTAQYEKELKTLKA